MSQTVIERAIAANPPKFRLGQRVRFTYSIQCSAQPYHTGVGIITGISWQLQFETGRCTWNYDLETLEPAGEQDTAWEDELSAVMEVAA